eukprot:g2148.t1
MKRTGTSHNASNTIVDEVDPKISLLDTLCVDKNLIPTENKEYTGFSTRVNMILLLNNIDQKINIPKDFTKTDNELKVYTTGGKTTHILVYYGRCWYICNFNSPNKPLEKKITRKIKSKKHIAVKVRSIVGNYITGIGNTIQVFLLNEYVKILKHAGLPYLNLQKVLQENVEEPLDLLECLAQKFTDVDISKQEIKLFMDAGTSFKPRDVPIDVDGANIARNVVVRILKSLIVYMGIYNIEDKHGVIEHLHRVKKNIRVHKRIERGMKQKTKKLKVKTSAVPQKEVTEKDFYYMVERQLKIPLKSKGSIHSFKSEQIYSMRKDETVFKYLSLLMDLKAAIDPTIANPLDLVKYILSNPKGSDCVDALIATCVLHRHKLPTKKTEKTVENFNLFGPVADRWFDFFINLLHGASGMNQRALIQVLTPWIIQKLYHPRDIAMLGINIISEKDFDGIPNGKHLNQIYIIVIQNGYRVFIKQNKNKRNKDTRYDPDIDKIVVDKDEEKLLKYIHMEYNALTEHIVTHESTEKRFFISRETDTFGRNEIKKYHAFPLLYPMHNHGNKYFLSLQGYTYAKGDTVDLDMEKINFLNQKKITSDIKSRLEKIEVLVNGKAYNLTTTSYANKGTRQSTCLFQQTSVSMNDVMNYYCKIINKMKDLSGTGIITLPEIGLDVICRKQSFSEFGTLRPKYACGRYQKSIELFSYRLLHDNIVDLNVKQQLQIKINDFEKELDHSEYITKKHYDVTRGTRYEKFATFHIKDLHTNPLIERLSGTPDGIGTYTLQEPRENDTRIHMSRRAYDSRYLTLEEQVYNHWYLKQFFMAQKILDNLNGVAVLKKKFNDTMQLAKKRYREKFKKRNL